MPRLPGSLARGKRFEAHAERWLVARGLEPLDRNYRMRGGEIDLVMADGETVVFVEVRFRAGTRLVGALESVTAAKQQRIARTAASWLQGHPGFAGRPCRFDVVGIEGAGEALRVDWIRDAFTA